MRIEVGSDSTREAIPEESIGRIAVPLVRGLLELIHRTLHSLTGDGDGSGENENDEIVAEGERVKYNPDLYLERGEAAEFPWAGSVDPDVHNKDWSYGDLPLTGSGTGEGKEEVVSSDSASSEQTEG